MNAFTRLARIELKLFLRDRTMVFFVVGLPILLVAIFGSLAHPKSDHDPVLIFLPAAALSVGLAGLAFNTVPTVLATYRERGILRRLAVTPIHPSRLLLAQLTVAVAAAAATAVLVVAVGRAGFGFALPRAPLAFLVAFLLGALALLAVGLVLAAVAPSGRAATGIGMFVFLLSQFAGGAFVPREQLPSAVARISEYTPLGATLEALRTAWTGSWAAPAVLLVLAGYAVVLGAAAVRTFRWE